MLNFSNDSVHPFDFHVSRFFENVFKEIECKLIHLYYPDEDEDEDEDEDSCRSQREIEQWGAQQRNLV